MSPVLLDVNGAIATITLDDHEHRNALGADLVAGIHEALVSANADEAVRVIVLTHSGNVFCAGANLKERAGSPGSAASGSIGFGELLTLIQTGPKPIVARIAGATMGGGIGLACASDIAVTTDVAKFGFTEVRLGVAPAIISVVALPKMGRGPAMEAFLRGDRFDGTRAAQLGLVAHAVPAAELDTAVHDVVSDLLRGSPAALAAAKRLVNEVPTMTKSDAFDWATAFSLELFAGAEAAEGMQAFLERRDASWVPEDP